MEVATLEQGAQVTRPGSAGSQYPPKQLASSRSYCLAPHFGVQMKDVYPIEQLLKFQVTARMRFRSCEQQYIEDDATIGSENNGVNSWGPTHRGAYLPIPNEKQKAADVISIDLVSHHFKQCARWSAGDPSPA